MIRALNALEEKYDQAKKILEIYDHLKGDDLIRLPIPHEDMELAAMVLLKTMDGESAGFVYPHLESNYCLLPLLGPLAHLYVGCEKNHVIFFSRGRSWTDFYEALSRNAPGKWRYSHTIKSMHPHSHIGINGNYRSDVKVRKDRTDKVRLVFSKTYKFLEREPKKGLEALIVDSGPPRYSLSEERFKNFLSYSEEHDIPLLVLMNNPYGPIYRKMDDLGVPIYGIKNHKRNVYDEEYLENLKCCVGDGSTLLKNYGMWSNYILKSVLDKDIKIVETDCPSEIKSLHEILLRIREAIPEKGKNVPMLKMISLSSYVDSVIRTLWFPRKDYEIVSSKNRWGEKLDTQQQHISRLSTEIYESNAELGNLGIDFAQKLRDVLDFLKGDQPTKVIRAERIVNEDDGKTVFLNYGKIPSMAHKNFLKRTGLFDGARVLHPGDLDGRIRFQKIIMPGYPLYSQLYLLNTISTNNLEIWCYPWEVEVVKKRFENLLKRRNELDSNSRSYLSGKVVQKWSSNKDPKRRGVKIKTRKGKASSSVGAKKFEDINVPSLLDKLERGYSPDLIGGESNGRVYEDSGSGDKWRVETDLGTLKLLEERNLTVVHHTYSVRKNVRELEPSDIIMVGKDLNPKSMEEYVWEILERKGISHEHGFWREWLIRLEEYLEENPNKDYRDVFKEMKETEKCTLETPNAVYSWLHEDIMGPSTKGTLEALGEVLGVDKEEVDYWEASIEQVRSAKASAFKHLWKLCRSYSHRLAEGIVDDVLISEEYNIWLSDLEEMISFAEVLSKPKKIDSE